MSRYNNLILPDASNPDKEALVRDLLSALAAMDSDLGVILNKGISLDDNVDIAGVVVTSHATPGTEFSVAHDLGKVPQGYIVAGQNGAGSLYDGDASHTASTLYFKSNAGSINFKVLVF